MKSLAREYFGFREEGPHLMAVSFRYQTCPGSPKLAANIL